MSDLSRRGFVKDAALKTVAASACLCGLSGLGGCATYTKIGTTPAVNPEALAVRDNVLSVDLSKEPNLGNVGGSVKILDARIRDDLIVARVEEDRFEVVSLRCTHRGVEVEYRHQDAQFQCASIGSSVFALDGERVSGPASGPLRAYEGVLRNGTLTIGV